MIKKVLLVISLVALAATGIAQSSIYDYEFTDGNGVKHSMAEYKGKVVLIVNTATECGFTPHYTDMEAMYKKYHAQGLEILDFPCNQFGEQAPGSDEEIASFCVAHYGTEFPQMSKCDVNGDAALPLFTYLKRQKCFEGFDKGHRLSKMFEKMYEKKDPNWRENCDIKWNFTKFLVDREGRVIARFEPTRDMQEVMAEVAKALGR